jgi:L-alanine-DL-glutamate epimerase-like enolase superfamily enzyme
MKLRLFTICRPGGVNKVLVMHLLAEKFGIPLWPHPYSGGKVCQTL